MKRIACKILNGRDCPAIIEAQTLNELMEKFWDHVMFTERHERLAEYLIKMGHSEQKHWQDRMGSLWSLLADYDVEPVVTLAASEHIRRRRVPIPRVEPSRRTTSTVR